MLSGVFAAASFLLLDLGLVLDLAAELGSAGVVRQRRLLVAALVFAVVTASMRSAASRGATLLSACLSPPIVVVASFAIFGTPYVKQSLGLSHTAGAVLLLIVPGLVALLVTASREQRAS